MNFEYETERLLLKILPPTARNTAHVLDFYNRNRESFERYEAARPPRFYTTSYQNSLLTCEYNLAMRQSSLRFWLYEKENPHQIIGTICFHRITHSVYQTCEVGYKTDGAFRRKGYAKEALTFGIKLMFDELKLHRIEAFVMPENTPSIHLLESLHFEREGICRQSICIRGNWEDHALYALIK